MKTRSCKNKGIVLQKIVAEKISKLLGIDWGKDKEIRSREAGQQGTDVVLSERVESLFPFAIECKNQESLNLWAAIDQAKSNAKENTSWILFCKRNRIDPIVILDASEFFDIYSDALQYNLGKQTRKEAK